jgi:drug/metabolite transporter (DMT)-like permease
VCERCRRRRIPQRDVPSRLAYLLLLLAPGLWSANMIVARWAAGWFPPHALAFWRWTIALVPMLALCGAALWRRRAEVRHEWRDLLLLGALGMWICGAFVYIAGETTTATNIGLIYAGVPILVMLLSARVFHEPLSAAQFTGAIVALAGVLVIIVKGEPGTLLRLAFTRGDLWALSAASCWAIYTVLLRQRPTALDPFLRLTAITAAGILVLLPFTLVEALVVGLPPLEWRSLIAAGVVGLLPGFGAYQAYSRLVRELGPARAGLVLYLTPLYTAAIAWLLLGEPVRWYHALGAALVFPGLLLASRGARR